MTARKVVKARVDAKRGVFISLVFFVILALHDTHGAQSPNKSAEEKCKMHFPGGKPPTGLNAIHSYSTCHFKDDEVFFYNIYDEGVLHGSVTLHKINHKWLVNTSSGRRGFTQDPELQARGVKQVSPENPASGYGTVWYRGHLGPNQMFSFDKSPGGAWDQCYYASNIAPQDFQFNQVGWKFLEANVYDYIDTKRRDLYIITGTYYNATLGTHDRNIRRLPSGLGIPDYYYKIICDDVGGQSAAFAGRNELHHIGMESLEFMPVKKWENITGIDFHLPAKCRPTQVDPAFWNFTYAVKKKPHLENIFGPFAMIDENGQVHFEEKVE